METIEAASPRHLDELTSMGLALWPDNQAEALRAELIDILSSPRQRLLVALDEGVAVGFACLRCEPIMLREPVAFPAGTLSGIWKASM